MVKLTIIFLVVVNSSVVEDREYTYYDSLEICQRHYHQKQFTTPANRILIGGYCEETNEY